MNKPTDHDILPSFMPEKVFIITDMQFDQAKGVSTYDDVLANYALNGLKVPEIIFWNVRENINTMPVNRDTPGVCCIAGFSPNILKVILQGKIPNPYDIMKMSLDAERYDKVVYVPD